jgi:hypothetical protein
LNKNEITLTFYEEHGLWQLATKHMSIDYSDAEIQKVKQKLNIKEGI